MSWYDTILPWRRAPQNQVIATSADLAKLLQSGQDTDSGIDVTAKTAFNLATFYAAVRVVSEDVAKLPLILYRRDPADPRSKDRAVDHPLFRLLHDRPNDWQSSFDFRQMMQTNALVRGNAYAIPIRVRGQIAELIPLDPTRVSVEQDPDFTVRYRITQRERDDLVLRPDQILHLKGPSLDGLTGMSIVETARNGIGLGLATEKYGSRFFRRGAKPGLILTHPASLSDTALENLKGSLDTDYSGDNAFRSLVLEEGMTPTFAAMSNEDSQFLETRKFQVTEIARWFRVPPHKIGDLDRATFSNIEMQSIEYVTDTLMPWAVRWEQAINHTLLAGDLFVEHLFAGLLRGTTKERFESYAIAVQNGWMSRNEVRAAENQNPVEGLDEYLTPLNMREGQEETEAANAVA